MFVFAYEFDAKDISELTLPGDENIIILAAAGVNGDIISTLAYPMYDRISGRNLVNRFTAKQLKDIEKTRKDTAKPAHKNKRCDKKVIV